MKPSTTVCYGTIGELMELHPCLSGCAEEIVCAVNLLVECYERGGQVLVCGNGGSAADSEHIVGELMKSFRLSRAIDKEFSRSYADLFGIEPPSWLEGSLPTISLVSHTAFTTAFMNDENSVGIFAQQVYGYGRPGDVLWCISTSGTSRNVVEAAKVAVAKGLRVIALTGERSTILTELSTVAIRVPATQTHSVQELHLPVYHGICAAVEARMFPGEGER